MRKARYESVELRGALQDLDAFMEAAGDLSSQRNNSDLRTRVAEAAGRAARVAEMTNQFMSYRAPPIAGGHQLTYNPIAAWDSDIDPFIDPLEMSILHAHQCRGSLSAQLEQAAREEKSLVGRTARVVGFASRVRHHLADRGFSAAAQRASLAATLTLQILAAVVAGLMVTWLTTILISGI